jgi:3-oxo-5-alpha-steroid 4-dehydrogenase 1
MHSDNIIRNLRVPGENEHKIPYSGMFRFVSCPSYLGEITEWAGWATMTWSFPGLLFVAWTFANLAPRARSTHQWYQKKFPNYPKNRKALIPFIY